MSRIPSFWSHFEEQATEPDETSLPLQSDSLEINDGVQVPTATRSREEPDQDLQFVQYRTVPKVTIMARCAGSDRPKLLRTKRKCPDLALKFAL